VRIHTLRGAQLEQTVLGVTPTRARPVLRVLEEGLQTAALATRATAGSIFVGSQASALECVAAFGPGAEALLRHRSPPHRDLAARALRQAEPLLVSQIEPDPQFADGTSTRTRIAWLGSMRDRRKSLGILQLVNPQGSGEFSEHEIRVATGMMQYITTSIIQTSSLRRAYRLAAHDPLTGLPNIRELDTELQRTANALEEAVRGVGSVFRFGGDEFVVIQRSATEESALALANHLRSHVAANTPGRIRSGGLLPAITVSVGIAILSTLRSDPGAPRRNKRARLMTTADRALFRAKAEGRNRVVLATREDDRL
jgi:diguanylate cyclase (GGDEF)-like protein